MSQPSQTISPLRQRMIDDMTLRKLNPRTQEAYIRSVVKLTRFCTVHPTRPRPMTCGAFSCIWPRTAFPTRPSMPPSPGCAFSSRSHWMPPRHFAR